mmetsp:Transcript_11879/g.27688  ORF Transcript_11879/g.27688 Transcript_11879/m.27688 type:complete len:1106 (-) Transcript_11879:168-3485(-)
MIVNFKARGLLLASWLLWANSAETDGLCHSSCETVAKATEDDANVGESSALLLLQHSGYFQHRQPSSAPAPSAAARPSIVHSASDDFDDIHSSFVWIAQGNLPTTTKAAAGSQPESQATPQGVPNADAATSAVAAPGHHAPQLFAVQAAPVAVGQDKLVAAPSLDAVQVSTAAPKSVPTTSTAPQATVKSAAHPPLAAAVAPSAAMVALESHASDPESSAVQASLQSGPVTPVAPEAAEATLAPPIAAVQVPQAPGPPGANIGLGAVEAAMAAAMQALPPMPADQAPAGVPQSSVHTSIRTWEAVPAAIVTESSTVRGEMAAPGGSLLVVHLPPSMPQKSVGSVAPTTDANLSSAPVAAPPLSTASRSTAFTTADSMLPAPAVLATGLEPPAALTPASATEAAPSAPEAAPDGDSAPASAAAEGFGQISQAPVGANASLELGKGSAGPEENVPAAVANLFQASAPSLLLSADEKAAVAEAMPMHTSRGAFSNLYAATHSKDAVSAHLSLNSIERSSASRHQNVETSPAAALAGVRGRKYNRLLESTWLGQFFSQPYQMTPSELLVSASVYAAFLATGTHLVSEAGMLLLLIPGAACLSKRLVLPIARVLPLSLVTMASTQPGIARVAVGGVIGCNLTLLSFFWLAVILAGRVDVFDGTCDYRNKLQRPVSLCSMLLRTGIELRPETKNNIRLMLLSSSLFLLQPQPFMSMTSLIAYVALLWAAASTDSEPKENSGIVQSEDRLILQAFEPGPSLHSSPSFLVEWIIPRYGLGLYWEAVRNATSVDNLSSQAASQTDESVEVHSCGELQPFAREALDELFRRHGRGGGLDLAGFEAILADLQLSHTPEQACNVFTKAPAWPPGSKRTTMTSSSGEAKGEGPARINHDSFMFCISCLALSSPSSTSSADEDAEGDGFGSEELRQHVQADLDEEPEVQPKWKDLEPSQQRRYLWLVAILKFAVGTCMLLVFTEPYADTMGDIGFRSGAMLYVALCVTPAVLYGNDFLSMYWYAKQKTSRSATVGISTIAETVCLNNIVCFGMLHALCAVESIQLEIAPELVSLFFVQVCMGLFALRRPVQSLLDGLWIGNLIPIFLISAYLMRVAGMT